LTDGCEESKSKGGKHPTMWLDMRLDYKRLIILQKSGLPETRVNFVSRIAHCDTIIDLTMSQGGAKQTKVQKLSLWLSTRACWSDK
jgi:hypothetical protein